MTTATALKFYATRDSAVAVLRKAGIAKADYATHLVIEDGKFAPDLNVGRGDKKEEEERAAAAEVKAIVEKAKARNAANVKALATPFTGLGKKEKAEAAAPAKKVAKTKAVKTEGNGEKNVGISEWIRSQITAGKSNKEILDMSEKAGFDLSGSKRYFPAWYRFDLKRKAAAAAK